jgi:protein-tyrosine phosphatase/nicotinamidase-related amidase
MPRAVLITQCLQQDFVGLVDAHAPLPNPLHVGRQEAVRLLGRDPASGPVAQLMEWARSQSGGGLEIVHIRDWHDASDPRQAAHLAQFGPHCLQGSEGAKLVLNLDDQVAVHDHECFVESLTLNDFDNTQLSDVLDQLRAGSPDGELRVGVVGVWTEAKVTFLLYELRTRCGIASLATCSALTASASRTQHFNALNQLTNILGVEVFDSVGDFTTWLLPDGSAPVLPGGRAGFGPSVALDGDGAVLDEADKALLGHLFRDSASVTLKPLGGGFSGARVFSARSIDPLGQEQAPSVFKIGPRELIGTERVAFERVEEVLGNDAPSVLGFAELGDRAGLRYAYAAMGRGGVQTFQSLYTGDASLDVVEETLDTVFGEILGRFYRASQYERLCLLDHYGFSPRWADSVERKVRDLVPDVTAERFTFPGGTTLDNLVGFYRDFLANVSLDVDEFHFVSTVHGDLNGANILIDGRQNVWIIDFFHTARSHVLKDLAKLENDLLYIFTPLRDESELIEALCITAALRAVDDLRAPLPEQLDGVHSPHLIRAWSTVRILRTWVAKLARSDRQPLQMSIARLRYAAHTLSFDESDRLQRVWALAAACGFAEDIRHASERDHALRVDWLPRSVLPGPGRLGLTICPGRTDWGRDLDADLDALAGFGVRRVVALLTTDDLEWAGVGALPRQMAQRGFGFVHLPIPDQGVPSLDEVRALNPQIRAWLDAGEDVVVHCLGGLGRSGLLAATLLVDAGLSAEAAIQEVREARDPRAIETRSQEDFVARYAVQLG